MDHPRRPHLLSTSSPASPLATSPTQHRPSQSPFRYVHFPEQLDEKPTPLASFPRAGPSSSPRPPFSPRTPFSPRAPQRPAQQSAPSSPVFYQHLPPSPVYSRPRGLRIANLLRPWVPLIIYIISSLTFVVAIAFFKTEVFTFLDDLSVYLREDLLFGYGVLFVLIFLTTFPPIPMYSTLIVLSGYTFGPWAGATLSYFAALSGALTVFVLSRTLMRNRISRWLESACTIKRVVRAVEKRPKLLFLVRLAPYPYNVMNCLLAASPTLTLKTYTVCTAASLFKVIIHTSLGASIHSFKAYNTADGEADGSADTVARLSTIGGVLLCVAIFVYLSVVARRAVDSELSDETGDAEETAGFLANDVTDLESGPAARPMVQLRS
ncbi:hypothetical protein B0H15DRAFT_881104 [Mycena belliarum]|uniref:Golgi apparatus membrane protein TVP38 n=1 Tax=Mycena belliarum TaxID=1033014 RepID=A0AAD6XV60_9AGAR|nr:hypothetical protein B0H15DRAFT_881104 [Mycena belliae]